MERRTSMSLCIRVLNVFSCSSSDSASMAERRISAYYVDCGGWNIRVGRNPTANDHIVCVKHVSIPARTWSEGWLVKRVTSGFYTSPLPQPFRAVQDAIKIFRLTIIWLSLLSTLNNNQGSCDGKDSSLLKERPARHSSPEAITWDVDKNIRG